MHAVPESHRGKRGAGTAVARHPEHVGALDGAMTGLAMPDDAALDDDAAPLFSVGQVAQLVGLQPWFLRRLDSMGVVTPTRSEGDHRRYSRADIRRLLAARALMHDGVSVAGVRYVFELEKRVAELEDALRAARRPGTRRTGNGAREPARKVETSCDGDVRRQGSREEI